MATSAMTSIAQHTTPRATLFVAFALSTHTWKLGVTTGSAQHPRERRVPARAMAAVWEEITRAKQRLGLPEDARVVSCGEAGRDGFWLHHCLVVAACKQLPLDPQAWAVSGSHSAPTS
jgi:transposase